MVPQSITAVFISGGGRLFWSIPPTYSGRDAAASGIAVISALGILGGFVSPTLIGWTKVPTSNIQMDLLAMTTLVICGGILFCSGYKERDPSGNHRRHQRALIGQPQSPPFLRFQILLRRTVA
jgi:nitrate/nitrite transporter NarK